MIEQYDSILPDSLSELTVKYIVNKIMSGIYKPGEKINESEIAKTLNISRAPIREALKELQIRGLINFIPRKGSTVARLSSKEIDEIFDLRIMLEKDVFRIILDKNIINEKNINILREKADKLANLATNKDINESEKVYLLNKLDLDFHEYLWKLAESPRRANILNDLYLQLLIAMNKDIKTLGRVEEKAKEHHDLIEKLLNSPLIELQNELETHINHYRNELYALDIK